MDSKFDILKKVEIHASQVKHFIHDPGYQHIITVLVGSQNYNLDSENSDIDTYSFVAPKIEDLIYGKEPISKEYDVEDGKCVVKDIRLGLNLLRKPSPNSVECFVSEYKYYEPMYNDILQLYLNEAIQLMIHSNYKNMVDAIAGTARGLHGRNMIEGKKFAHCLRLKEMYERYLDSHYKPYELLKLRIEDLVLAREAKFDTSEISNQYYKEERIKIALMLTEQANLFKPTKQSLLTEELGQNYINKFQTELFNRYLKENGYEKKN